MTARVFQRFVSCSAVLAGVAFLYVGWGAALLPGPVIAPATVAWAKQVIIDLCQYIWLPAVGVLLLVIGLFPMIAQQTRRNRLAQFGVGLAGLGLIGGSGLALGIPPGSLGEFGYLLPLFVAGLLLMGLVLPS